MVRVRVTLTALVTLAVVGVGVLTRSLAWPAGPGTALVVASVSTLTVLAGALALRILVVAGTRPGESDVETMPTVTPAGRHASARSCRDG